MSDATSQSIQSFDEQDVFILVIRLILSRRQGYHKKKKASSQLVRVPITPPPPRLSTLYSGDVL